MWAVTVNGNWRLTFYFEGQDAHLVDYQDYHQEGQNEKKTNTSGSCSFRGCNKTTQSDTLGSGAASSEECYPVSICGIRRSRSIADVMIMKSSEQ